MKNQYDTACGGLLHLYCPLLGKKMELIAVYLVFCRIVLVSVLTALLGAESAELSRAASVSHSTPEAKSQKIQQSVSDKLRPPIGHKQTRKKASKSVSGTGAEIRVDKSSPTKKMSAKAAGAKKLKGRALSAVTAAPMDPRPKIDMGRAYYGLLEQSQRYNPGQDRGTGRVLHPQTGELLSDHFLELDRNSDGVIDPFERAVSRLHIHRDLHN